jgi:Restriction endonuclease
VNDNQFRSTTFDGRAFEREVAAIFRALGAEVEHDVAVIGMQIDVMTRERTPSGTVIRTAVECKSYSRPVGIDIVSQFANAFQLLRQNAAIDKAMIVAASGFTRQAREAARATKLDLVEFEDLKQRLGTRSSELVQARIAVEAESTTHKRRDPRAFVVMPFAAEFQDVYIL